MASRFNRIESVAMHLFTSFFRWKEGGAAEFFLGRWFLGEDLLDKFLQAMFDDFLFDLYIKYSYRNPNILHG